MGQKQSKNKFVLQIYCEYDSFIKTHQCINESKINNFEMIAVKSQPNISNLTNRKILFKSSYHDICFVNDRKPLTTNIDGKKHSKYLYINNNYDSIYFRFGKGEFGIGMAYLKTLNIDSHTISHKLRSQYDKKYHIVSINLTLSSTMSHDIGADSFTIICVKTVKTATEQVISFENGNIITHMTVSSENKTDDPLPQEIINEINEYLSQISSDDKYYIINFDNSDCLKKIYTDKCFDLIEI
jgi:hypothetical protein